MIEFQDELIAPENIANNMLKNDWSDWHILVEH